MSAIKTANALSASGAQTLIDGAAAKANEIGVPQCITIVDPAGDLLAFLRMDGAKLMSIDTSRAKAVTAARTRSQSGPLPEHLGLAVAAATNGSFTELRGGMPVVIGGTIVGAIGVGSGTPAQDEEVATAALHFLEENT